MLGNRGSSRSILARPMRGTLASVSAARRSSDSAIKRFVGGACTLMMLMGGSVTAHDGTHGHAQGQDPSDVAVAIDDLSVSLVATELVVGPNRFALGLHDATGRHVQDVAVHLRYFDLRDPTAPVVESEADATSLSTPDGFTTIFAHERAFDWAGPWGVEIQVLFQDGRLALKRIAFDVSPVGQALAPGQPVPHLHTRTIGDVGGDLTLLSSALAPNPLLYATSLADAVRSGRPTVVLFATPGFCRTRFCGPSYATTTALQERFGHEVDFVHVEIFAGMPDPAADGWQLAPAVQAFGLRTEPWLYLVDPRGTVAYRVEGMFTETEVERHLLSLLGR
jgi:hypothetical protein